MKDNKVVYEWVGKGGFKYRLVNDNDLCFCVEWKHPHEDHWFREQSTMPIARQLSHVVAANVTLEAERDRLRVDIKTIKDSLKKHTVAKRNIEDGISEITVRVTNDALKALEVNDE